MDVAQQAADDGGLRSHLRAEMGMAGPLDSVCTVTLITRQREAVMLADFGPTATLRVRTGGCELTLFASAPDLRRLAQACADAASRLDVLHPTSPPEQPADAVDEPIPTPEAQDSGFGAYIAAGGVPA